MIDFKKLIGKDKASIVPYQPGKPIKEVERVSGVKNAIKLASNENPLGCSPKAIKALNKFVSDISRYPAGDAYDLCQTICKFYKLKMANVLIGAGSDEIIQLLYLAFLQDDEEVLSPSPSFSEYYIVAKAIGGDCRWIDTNDDLSINFNKILKSITPKTRFIMLANPNNPTGLTFKESEFLNFIKKVRSDIIVVLDEAYIEYQEKKGQLNTVKLVKKHKNLVALRTFSKVYGLASMRVGFIIADAECIDMLHRVRQPFNVNMAAQVMAAAAIADQNYINKVIKLNSEGKRYIYKECKKLGIDVVPTEANYILIDVGDGKKVSDKLLKLGVIVRFLPHPKLTKYIRVSIGAKDENKIFIEKLKTVLKIKKIVSKDKE